jgi:hypothetical protein
MRPPCRGPGRLIVSGAPVPRAADRPDLPRWRSVGRPITPLGQATVSLDDSPATSTTRGVGARQALAVSNSVWAPSILVVIDASPWARRGLEIGQPRSSKTLYARRRPCRASAQGRYNVTCPSRRLCAELSWPQANAVSCMTPVFPGS